MSLPKKSRKRRIKKQEDNAIWVSPPQLQSGGPLTNPSHYHFQIIPTTTTWTTGPIWGSSFQFSLNSSPFKFQREPKATKRVVPVIGFRGWRVTSWRGQPSLQSVNPHLGVWAKGTTKARCKGKHKHRAPHYHCECGLYVLANLKDAPQWYAQIGVPADVVIGAVLGWGNVIQHGEEGWRAEYARPIAFLKSDVFVEQPLLYAVAERLKLPILERRGLELYAKEYGEALPRELVKR